jgi:hypothetical protein
VAEIVAKLQIGEVDVRQTTKCIAKISDSIGFEELSSKHIRILLTFNLLSSSSKKLPNTHPERTSVRIFVFCRNHFHPPLSVRKILTQTVSPTDNSDVKAIVAALHFIVNGAAKYDVGSETLETELQQLGLPKGSYTNPTSVFLVPSLISHRPLLTLITIVTENSEAISKVYIKAKDQLRAALLSRVLTCSFCEIHLLLKLTVLTQ